MLRQFRKYRKLLATGTVLFYLAGGLQFPLLECLHAFSHLGELVSKHYEKHSYFSHGGQHSHTVLDLIAGIEHLSPDDSTAPVHKALDSDIKKPPQHVATTVILYFANKIKISVPPYHTFPLMQHGPSVPTPPPKV